MNNKAKFKELLLDLEGLYENNSFKVKTFPIRSEFKFIKNKIQNILQNVELDMISINSNDKNLDIYQSYFEDYKLENGTLIVDFKYNKQRKIQLF